MDEATTVATAMKSVQQHARARTSNRIDALFVQHLLSDSVVEPTAANERQRFEAAARSVRDLLSQRWIDTQRSYDRENPKRVYYLSMEFLIGRSLSNNITNLMLHPLIDAAARESGLDVMGMIEQEPDAGLGNGGLGRLAACFLDSMATMQLPAVGYGLRYEYGMFRQSIVNGWQRERPDNWLRRQDPWEVSRLGGSPRSQTRLHLRDASGKPAGRAEPSVNLDRRSVRPADRRFRWQDDQHLAPLERGGP